MAGTLGVLNESGRDESELLWLQSAPDVQGIRKAVGKAVGLASIISDDVSVTQTFQTAEQLECAFRGELQELPDDFVASLVESIRIKFPSLIENHNLTEDDLTAFFKKVWIYARFEDPTCTLLEDVISELEGTEDSKVFATGLAAIHATVSQFTNPARRGESGEYIMGDTVVVIGSVYGGTNAQMVETMRETGRQVIFMTMEEFNIKGLPGGTKMVYFEPCQNPTLDVIPVDEVVQAARGVGAKVVCDVTFTPLTTKVADMGVDFVVHSLTKYVGGRSKNMGGSVSGSRTDLAKLKDTHTGKRMVEGASMSPEVAKNFLYNVADLPERLSACSRNARLIKEVAEEFGVKAKMVDDDPSYSAIRRPGVPDSISNGMIVLYFDDQAKAFEFINAMGDIGAGRPAVSLGSIESTLYSHPATTTHSEMTTDEQMKVGVTEGLVRMSCGGEKDLVEKFRKVLDGLYSN